jgi:hypothetical protein
VFGQRLPDGLASQLGEAHGEPCAAVIYLSVGSASYQGYSLDGGP